VAVPLAWLNLTHNRGRLVLFCAGVCFAVVLMFVQYGCRNALLDSSVLLIERMRADLIIRSRQQTTIMLRSTFPRPVLARARAVQGVAEAHPLYLEYAAVLRHTAEDEARRAPAQTIRVIGVDPDAFLLDFPELDPRSPRSRAADLRVPDQALFDARGRTARDRPGETVYGPVRAGTKTELSDHAVTLVGQFEMGIDFATDGSVIVSPETFRRCLRPPFVTDGLEAVDLGLVRLEQGADRDRALADLRAALADADVEVLTREQFAQHEKRFWLDNTPIGYVFGFGMAMGLLVGLVICYQVLSSDISDNLQAYATLRAIGYRGRYLVGVILQESAILALLGFVPGLALGYGAYRLLARLTELPMVLTPLRIMLILVLSLGMCMASGLLASRKAQQADPAEVF
jgi:putative ABC transport system permease protein